MDRELRKDIEMMIQESIRQLETRIELKFDIIVNMLKNNDNDHTHLKEEQITHRERLNNIDIKDAQRPITCTFRPRIEEIEKKLDKLVYKSSLITGLVMGIVFYLSPIIIQFLMGVLGM